jgi:hypothetical protein
VSFIAAGAEEFGSVESGIAPKQDAARGGEAEASDFVIAPEVGREDSEPKRVPTAVTAVLAAQSKSN